VEEAAAQANPGVEQEVLQIPPSSIDSGSLPEPVATPKPDSDSSTAGLTVAGTEHFIASSLRQGGYSSIKALAGFLSLTLERNPDSDHFHLTARQRNLPGWLIQSLQLAAMIRAWKTKSLVTRWFVPCRRTMNRDRLHRRLPPHSTSSVSNRSVRVTQR